MNASGEFHERADEMSDEQYWLKLAAEGQWTQASGYIREKEWGQHSEDGLKMFVMELSTAGHSPESGARYLADVEATYFGCLEAHNWRWLRHAVSGHWDDAVAEASEQFQWATADLYWLNRLIPAIVEHSKLDTQENAYKAFIDLLRGAQVSTDYFNRAFQFVQSFDAPAPAAEAAPWPGSSRQAPRTDFRTNAARRKRTALLASEILGRDPQTVTREPEPENKPLKDGRAESSKAGERRRAARHPKAVQEQRGVAPREGSKGKQRATAPDSDGEKKERLISSAVRDRITKLNVDGFGKLTQEADGEEKAVLKFSVYRPDEGASVLRFDVDRMPVIGFKHAYTGTLSIPAKGTRNPLTALRRRVNKENVRGDVAVWSNHPDFDPAEVTQLLQGTVTKKTVTQRYISVTEFLTHGIDHPMWQEVKEQTRKTLSSENTDFLEAIHKKELTPNELFAQFISDRTVNITDASFKPLRDEYKNGALNYVHFGSARKEVITMLAQVTDIQMLVADRIGVPIG
ncbi:hypothetical protein [Streptomyces sp. NPDC051014]|uniref:hypothetical protein n=1 Tax=Streptomyces sp. NPDC051014 TaxID=3155751 RepID=UPI00340F8C35